MYTYRHPCKCGSANCTGFLGSYRQESTQRGGTKSTATAAAAGSHPNRENKSRPDKKRPKLARRPAQSAEKHAPTVSEGSADSDSEQNEAVQSQSSTRDAVKGTPPSAKSRGQNMDEKKKQHASASCGCDMGGDGSCTAEPRNKRSRAAARDDDESPSASAGSSARRRLGPLAGSSSSRNSGKSLMKGVSSRGNKNADSGLGSEQNRTAAPGSLGGRTAKGRTTEEPAIDSDSGSRRRKKIAGKISDADAEAVYASRKALMMRH
jgi:hypothetical protein